MGNKVTLFILSYFFLLSFSFAQTNKEQVQKNEITLQDAFFSLDSVWAPGERHRYGLHPYSNYLWIQDGMATISTNERASLFSLYARGTIRGVKIKDDEQGYRTTYFYIAADQISVELTELPDNIFLIHIYKPLDKLDVMFRAFYVDPENVEELDMYFH